MKISELNIEDITPNHRPLIDRILFDGIEDDGKNGDVIFVFGSTQATKYRVPLAAKLYKAGRAPKILMSGGSAEKPEAEIMMEKAMELGVPDEDIILETHSTNTGENVMESKQILDSHFGLNQINRILVVSTLYHMRRCYLTLKTHMPSHIEYSLCAANDTNTRRDNWWLNEKGTRRVIKEVQGLIRYTRQGVILDYDFTS